MENKPIPSEERHIYVPPRTAVDRFRQSARRAMEDYKERYRNLSTRFEAEARWADQEKPRAESSQLCSERETITFISETLKQVVHILTMIKNHLTTSVTGGGKTDDGATSES